MTMIGFVLAMMLAAAAAEEGDSRKVWMFNEENQDRIMNNDIKTHLLVFVSNKADYYPMIEKAMERQVSSFGDKSILHCILPVEEEKAVSGVISYFDLDDDDFPLAVIVESDKGMKKFISSKILDGDVLLNFEKDFYDGKLKPDLKSMEVIGDEGEGVPYNMAGSEFPSMVMDTDKDVLLFIHAPWCGHCKRFKPEFVKAAKMIKHSGNPNLIVAMMDGTLNQVDHPEINVNSYPYFVAFRGDNKAKVLSAPATKAKDIVKFAQEKFVHDVEVRNAPEKKSSGDDSMIMIFDDDTSNDIMENEVKTHFLMFVSTEASYWPALKKVYEENAKKFGNEKLLHVYLPVEEEAATKGVISYFDLDPSEFPTAVIVETNKGMKKFIAKAEDLTAPGVLMQFEQDFYDGKLKPTLKSMDVVGDEGDGVPYNMAGSEFESMVIDNDKDVLLFIHAPWCGHCKRFKPEYEKAAKILKHSGNPNLVVAMLDGTINQVDHPEINVNSYPYFVAFRGDNKAKALSGPATNAAEIVQFAKDRFLHPVVEAGGEEPASSAKDEL